MRFCSVTKDTVVEMPRLLKIHFTNSAPTWRPLNMHGTSFSGASTEDPLSIRSLIWGGSWCGNGTRSPRRSLGTSWSLWDAVVWHAYHPTVVIHATEPAPVVVTFDLYPKVLFLLFSEWTSRSILYLTLCLYAKMIFLWNKLGWMKIGWKLLIL